MLLKGRYPYISCKWKGRCICHSAELVSGTWYYWICVVQYYFPCHESHWHCEARSSRPLKMECTFTHLHRNHTERGVQSQGTQELSLAGVTASLESKQLLAMVPLNFPHSPLLLSLGSLKSHMAGACCQRVRIITATLRPPGCRRERQTPCWGCKVSECMCVCAHVRGSAHAISSAASVSHDWLIYIEPVGCALTTQVSELSPG